MAKVSEIHPYPWLRAEDLDGKEFQLRIASVEVKPVKQNNGSMEERAVVTFAKAQKKLICNKTQARIIAAVAGDDTDDWPGTVLKLSPAKTTNGKLTINIIPVNQNPPANRAMEQKEIEF